MTENEDIKEPQFAIAEVEVPDPDPVPTSKPLANPRFVPKPEDQRKSEQFTARCTKADFNRIKEAIDRRKEDGKLYDIVTLCLDMMDHIESDWFRTFKLKADD